MFYGLSFFTPKATGIRCQTRLIGLILCPYGPVEYLKHGLLCF